MIAQYFIMNGKTDIEFISSANKLKLFIGNKKTTYNERKKISIGVSNAIFNKNNIYSEWQNFMNSHKKKDDLADCFLQGIYYLNEIKAIKEINEARENKEFYEAIETSLEKEKKPKEKKPKENKPKENKPKENKKLEN